jgi:anti-anti-sigma regulatory factor
MSVISDPPVFELTTAFEGRSARLALHGRLENVAALDLWAALERIIDLGEAVILDLSELDFIGAAGLLTLANAERRFAEAGVEFALRTPSDLIQRLLGAMGRTEVAGLDQALANVGNIKSEPVRESHCPSSPSYSTVSILDLRRVTAIPANPDVVDGVLRLVAELARVSVGGADGVSVSLFRGGTFLAVAATDEIFMKMDADQWATGEGPSIDASLQGSSFCAGSLVTDTRWPSFTPRARGLGITAMLALPLLAFGEPFGALNVYSRTASTFEVDAQRTAARFATQASTILRDAHVAVDDPRTALRSPERLGSRERVAAPAKEVLSDRETFNEDDVFTNLLRRSVKTKPEHVTELGSFEQGASSRA